MYSHQLEMTTDNFINVFFSVFGGFFLAFAFVSHLIEYRKEDLEEDTETETDTETDTEDDISLEDRYYEELNALVVRDMTKEELEALHTIFLDVDTPDGLVKMTYNSVTESFWYYADNKNIHYKYLDAVARLFTVENNCRQVCVNYKEEYENGIHLVKMKIAKEEEQKLLAENNVTEAATTATVKKSVFAKFKNYKVDNNSDTNSNRNDKKQKYFVLVDKANQFRFAGSMNDYKNEAAREEQKKATESIPYMDYATFKNLCMNKQMSLHVNNHNDSSNNKGCENNEQ